MAGGQATARKRGRPKGSKNKPKKPRLPGVVNANENYTLERFTAITGLHRSAVRDEEAKGLETAIIACRKYINGQAWLDHVARQAKLRRGKKV